MDQEFITIGEAARLLQKTDSVVMRLIKEALQAGVEKENIMKTEMREGRMMYLVSRAFLIEETAMEQEESPKENVPEQHVPKKAEDDSELMSLKNDMIATLQKVIDTKDQQISDLSGKIDQLIERDHETNILMKGLQDRLFLLEQGNSQDSSEEAEKKKGSKRAP